MNAPSGLSAVGFGLRLHKLALRGFKACGGALWTQPLPGAMPGGLAAEWAAAGEAGRPVRSGSVQGGRVASCSDRQCRRDTQERFPADAAFCSRSDGGCAIVSITDRCLI